MAEKRTAPADWEVWADWRQLVNMSESELKDYYNSDAGEESGLSPSEASAGGIDYGRESARMLKKMIPTGKTWEDAQKNWTPSQWFWARKQVSFNSRMRGNKGPLFKDGEKTRKHKSLLIWGHDPTKPMNKRPSKPAGLEKEAAVLLSLKKELLKRASENAYQNGDVHLANALYDQIDKVAIGGQKIAADPTVTMGPATWFQDGDKGFWQIIVGVDRSFPTGGTRAVMRSLKGVPQAVLMDGGKWSSPYKRFGGLKIEVISSAMFDEKNAADGKKFEKQVADALKKTRVGVESKSSLKF